MDSNAFSADRTKGPRHWLGREVAATRAGGLPALFLLFDTGAAIGFAWGLALALVAIPQGPAAVVPGAALALAAGIARGFCTVLALRSGARAAEALKNSLRMRLAVALLRRPPGSHRDADGPMSAVVDGVGALEGHVARFLPARTAAAGAPAIVLVATALASPVAAGIQVLTLLPFILALALAGGASADESRRQFDALARLTGRFADRVRALPVVIAFGAVGQEADAMGRAANELAWRTMRVLRLAFLSSAALEFFAALSVALVAVYCGFNLLGLLPFPVPERLDLFEAFFVLALAPEFYAPMRRLAAAYHDRQAAESAAEVLMTLDAAQPESPEAVAPERGGAVALALVFAGVSIRYPEAERDAVSDLSFAVAPRERVALLGPSGSGKTSLLHALLGLAPLRAGDVLVDGRPLETVAMPRLVAWAGQHPMIIEGTIRENLLLAWPEATAEEVSAAVAAAGLEPLLARRTGGLDHRLDARGGGLSGGELRRLSLARALLKPAPLLLLDEPTAHLDPVAEAGLIATIAKAGAGRTMLVATHSRALAAVCDRSVRIGEDAA